MDYLIRNELPGDQRRVEEVTREAFWNLHVPGCDEHYLVHSMRGHPDFVPELNFVISVDGVLIGNIVYTRSRLVGPMGETKSILTFGPVSILPEYQNQGFGKRLIEHSLEAATLGGWDAVVIYGSPRNYLKYGFKSCHRYTITNAEGAFPSALLVKELKSGALRGGPWRFHESEAYATDPQGFEEFDATFPHKVKEESLQQEEFYILSRSTMR